MNTNISRPYWLMIIGLTALVCLILLQRLAAPALGIATPESEGHKTMLLIWCTIGGGLFVIGLTMTVFPWRNSGSGA